MTWRPDWEGIAQERKESWEVQIHHQHLLAQLPRQRPAWRRWTGGALKRAGGWLTRLGDWMAGSECQQEMSVES